MKLRRDLLILGVMLGLLVIFTFVGTTSESDDALSGRPSTYAGSPTGSLALLRWLDNIGYDAGRLENTFDIDPQTSALFILRPSNAISPENSEQILTWVEKGGVLILGEDRGGLGGPANRVFRDLELATFVPANAERIERAPTLQPLDRPPVREVPVRAERLVSSERNDLAALVGNEEGPVVVGLRYGQGYIYASSSIYMFTNFGLREAGNAALILNMLRWVPDGGRVLFDEYHHGFVAEGEQGTLRSLLTESVWGRALIYSLVICGLFLILQGRRFGRPIPLPEEVARRNSAEYVENMADLFRRCGKRDYVGQHYHSTFKRRLARPFGLNPALPDDQFVQELAVQRSLDSEALRTLLSRLRQPPASDEALLKLLREADQFPLR